MGARKEDRKGISAMKCNNKAPTPLHRYVVSLKNSGPPEGRKGIKWTPCSDSVRESVQLSGLIVRVPIFLDRSGRKSAIEDGWKAKA